MKLDIDITPSLPPREYTKEDKETLSKYMSKENLDSLNRASERNSLTYRHTYGTYVSYRD